MNKNTTSVQPEIQHIGEEWEVIEGNSGTGRRPVPTVFVGVNGFPIADFGAPCEKSRTYANLVVRIPDLLQQQNALKVVLAHAKRYRAAEIAFNKSATLAHKQDVSNYGHDLDMAFANFEVVQNAKGKQ